MKGFIAKLKWSAAYATGGLFLMSGCCPHYNNVVDPCWPERYNSMARKEIDASLAPGVNNGHVLDQTIWSNHFERDPRTGTPTAKLTLGGIDHLIYLTRRRPHPDPTIYLQNAQDVEMANLEHYVEERNKLNRDRIESIQKFLNAYTDGRQLTFNVVVLHDPLQADQPAIAANPSIRNRLLSGPAGVLPFTSGTNGASPAPAGSATTGSFQ